MLRHFLTLTILQFFSTYTYSAPVATVDGHCQSLVVKTSNRTVDCENFLMITQLPNGRIGYTFAYKNGRADKDAITFWVNDGVSVADELTKMMIYAVYDNEKRINANGLCTISGQAGGRGVTVSCKVLGAKNSVLYKALFYSK
jgi:hypothetical protein